MYIRNFFSSNVKETFSGFLLLITALIMDLFVAVSDDIKNPDRFSAILVQLFIIGNPESSDGSFST